MNLDLELEHEKDKGKVIELCRVLGAATVIRICREHIERNGKRAADEHQKWQAEMRALDAKEST